MHDPTLIKLLLLLPPALMIYYLLPRRVQSFWLLGVSYLFYATWTWTFPLVLLLMTLGNFILGQEIKSSAHRRSLLVLGIVFNVALLGLAKYAGGLIDRMPDPLLARLLAALGLFGLPDQPDLLTILLPIGLSFRVLEGIAYLVDIANDRLEPAADLVDFAVFFAYFPKLIAGPIERAQTFLPRLQVARTVDEHAWSEGFALILVGTLRKLLLADALRSMAPPGIYERPQDFSALALVTWLVAFGFALYNDFAGYTSIVRGISKLFGLELSINFQQPYFARSFNEFWNRWHITLSHWLRDYIYFPIARSLAQRIPNRRHPVHLIIPPLAAMLTSALWHEVSPAMLLWGLLYAIYLIAWRIPSFVGRPITPLDKQPLWRQVMGAVLVFVLVMLAWVPFRMDLPTALSYWRTMLLGWAGPQITDPRPWVLIALTLGLDWLHLHGGELAYLKWPLLARAGAIALALLGLFIALTTQMVTTAFVYQGF